MASARAGGMSAGQVVLVTFGFLLASFLVFIFGMWVGKDIAERRLAQEERVFRAPIARPTAVSEPVVAVPAADVPRPPGGTPAPMFQLPGEARTSTPAELPPTPTSTLNLVVVSPARTPTRPQPTMPPQPALPEAQDAPTPAADEWADAGWTVQVTATTDPNGAEAIAARLRSRGYDAYTIKAPARGQIWHRVRVGRFATKSEAIELEQRLKSVEKLPGAFVTAR